MPKHKLFRVTRVDEYADQMLKYATKPFLDS